MRCDEVITSNGEEMHLNITTCQRWVGLVFFLKKNVASGNTVRHKSIFLPCFILWEPKKWLLSTAVFIECVSTAEITACITSLLSTCHHFAGKQPAECKGCDSLLILVKHLQLTNCRICGQTSGSFSQRQPSETFFALYSETRDERPPENETNQLWT